MQDLIPKGLLASKTDSDMLWTRYDGDYFALTPKEVIHGHVNVDQVEQRGNRMNINTGCGFGGTLTAFVMPERQMLQSRPSRSIARDI
jgi:serine/threonine protein phosphatase 1